MEILHSTCTVSKESGLSVRQLYYWELIGLICPRYETFGMRRFRRYTEEDLSFLKVAKQLLDQGYTLQAVKQNILSEKQTAQNGRDVQKTVHA
ncbi:MAG: MerR family transcriptional regulator [Candidatus Omnitrophica bacterium]|nr:MerR family transcriptional regulator [Candidatus Omnitrophota bacterium]